VSECVGECAPGGEVERRGKARRRRRGAGDRRPARGKKGRRGLEVEDGPDVWAPHVSGSERERERREAERADGPAWAECGVGPRGKLGWLG
jgi:hypothetical protein